LRLHLSRLIPWAESNQGHRDACLDRFEIDGDVVMAVSPAQVGSVHTDPPSVPGRDSGARQRGRCRREFRAL